MVLNTLTLRMPVIGNLLPGGQAEPGPVPSHLHINTRVTATSHKLARMRSEDESDCVVLFRILGWLSIPSQSLQGLPGPLTPVGSFPVTPSCSGCFSQCLLPSVRQLLQRMCPLADSFPGSPLLAPGLGFSSDVVLKRPPLTPAPAGHGCLSPHF